MVNNESNPLSSVRIVYIVPGMGKRLAAVLVLFSLGAVLLFANCVLGPNRYYAVMSSRGNRVFIRHNLWYTVGELPEPWETLKTNVRAVAWYNPELLSTISTDVLCEATAGDRPLSVVAGDVAAAIEDRTVSNVQKFTLDGRGALREKVVGSVDGVPLEMDLVVLKKNNCAFNMMAVASPQDMPSVRPYFEDFFNGFHFGSAEGIEDQ